MKTKSKPIRAYLFLKSKTELNSQMLLDVLKKSPYKVLHTYRNRVLIESTEDELKKLKERWQNPQNEESDWQTILNQYVVGIYWQDNGWL